MYNVSTIFQSEKIKINVLNNTQSWVAHYFKYSSFITSFTRAVAAPDVVFDFWLSSFLFLIRGVASSENNIDSSIVKVGLLHVMSSLPTALRKWKKKIEENKETQAYLVS